jgi:hypothetical protein
MHVPAGIFSAVLMSGWPLAGAALFAGFLVYEIVEDWRISDHSYKDVVSYLYGFGGTAAAIAIYRAW